MSESTFALTKNKFDVIIIPPAVTGDYYLAENLELSHWLIKQYNEGAILTSACAGAFILCRSGVLAGRSATTHWQFLDKLQQMFPNIKVDTDKILINHNDVITSGGLMSWLDLSLEIIAQTISPSVMRQLGKFLVVDTGEREQRFYRSFMPSFDHGDDLIIAIQHYMQKALASSIRITELAEKINLTERTFLRRFVKATSLKPTQYLQCIRVQAACDLLENTPETIDVIAHKVGYEDVSAFRKVFINVMGLTPKAFRKRFQRAHD